MHDLGARLELAVLRAQGGEADAFAALVRDCHGVLLRHARRYLSDPGLAADAVQDAWVAIVKTLRRLDDPARFLAWALRITARRAIDVARRRGRTVGVTVTGDIDGVVASPTAAGDDTERLRAAVAQLDFDHRVVVELFYLEELSLHAVAEATGLPAGTVKSRLHHARNRLRATLMETDDKE